MAVGQNVPQVIPALQQWKSAKGKLVLPEAGKVIVSPEEEKELKGEAEILVQDLKEMFGWEYSVVVGKKEKGAVYLTLGKPDKTLGRLFSQMLLRQLKQLFGTDLWAYLRTRHLQQEQSL